MLGCAAELDAADILTGLGRVMPFHKLGGSDKHRGEVVRTIFRWSQNAADL